MTPQTRKLITTRKLIFSELGTKAARPIMRAVGLGVIVNPFAGRAVEGLAERFQAGAAIGEQLMAQLVRLPDGPAVS